jgi:hypothetical protein
MVSIQNKSRYHFTYFTRPDRAWGHIKCSHGNAFQAGEAYRDVVKFIKWFLNNKIKTVFNLLRFHNILCFPQSSRPGIFD